MSKILDGGDTPAPTYDWGYGKEERFLLVMSSAAIAAGAFCLLNTIQPLAFQSLL